MTYIKKGDDVNAINDLKFIADYYERASKDVREKYPDQFTENEGYPQGENPPAELKKPKNDSGVLEVSEQPTGIGLFSISPGRGGSAGSNRFAEFEEKIIPDKWFVRGDKIFLDPMTMYGDAEVTYYLLGDLLEKNGDLSGAIDAFTKSIIAKSYDEGIIYMRRGKLHLKTGKFEPAVRDFSWAISMDGFAEAFLERGIAIYMLGHDAIARKDFDKFLKKLPEGKNIYEKRLAEAEKLRKELNARSGENK